MRTQPNADQPVWQTLDRRSLHRTPWLELVADDTTNAAGKPELYTHVVIPASVTILAHDTTRDLYAVTRQWIYTHGETQWRLPAGGTDHQGQAPFREIAEKELREEVGATAVSWTLLGKVHGADSVSNHADWVWLAEHLAAGEQQLEDGEADLVVHWLPFTALLDLVLSGQMPHAGSVFAVLAVAAHRAVADQASTSSRPNPPAVDPGRPWCGARKELGGQQPCPLKTPCDERTCWLGSADGSETYKPGTAPNPPEVSRG